MKKTEQELAQELDVFLTAMLQERPSPPVTAELEEEARLATGLLDLAGTMQPDPDFVVGLEAHLARAAARQKKSTPDRRPPSPWQALIQTVKEGFAMKQMKLALGVLLAVVVVGAAVFFFSQQGGGVEPGAVAGVETDAPATDDTAQPDTSAETPATDDTDGTAVADLPALPRLGATGMGTGFGGGGGGDLAAEETSMPAEDGMVIDEPFFWDPLRDATYVLNATLPTEPTKATVYQQPGNGFYTLEDAQRLAQAFGFSGTLYTEVYPIHEGPDGELWTPPTVYLAFDGLRTLSVSDSHFYYYDQGANPNYEIAPLPLEQATPIVEAFLRERGLLDFEFEMRSPYGMDVQVHRVLDGRVVNTPEYFVSVTQDGVVFSLSSTPMPQLTAAGTYPLRSAEAAWQLLLDEGINYDTTLFITYPQNPEQLQPQPVEDVPADQQYRYWERPYADGDSINLYAYPIVYMPLDETAVPRIQVDRYQLTGPAEEMRAIAEYPGQQVRITGIIRGAADATNRTLELVSWEPQENNEYQYMPGVIRRDGDQVLFDAEQGETFLIPNAPADLADGEKVYVNGWSIEPGEGEYRVFNWQGIDRIVEMPEVGIMPVEPGMVDEYKILQVEITAVDLVYAFTPAYDEATQTSTFFVQPAWRFRGTTDTDEIIELYVQATADEQLRPEPAG
ncbi:MAG: hypothetical protein KC425_12035 [Anaerolineales bacterium]|nr:hypothetical protein [Anaerolineales bacterium]